MTGKRPDPPTASPTLDDIGRALCRNSPRPAAPALIVGDVEEGSISLSFFVDMGDHIDFVPTSSELDDCFWDLWYEEEDAARRWRGIEYYLRDGHFTVRFIYPEDFNETWRVGQERHARALQYLGDKPLHYPTRSRRGAQFDLG